MISVCFMSGSHTPSNRHQQCLDAALHSQILHWASPASVHVFLQSSALSRAPAKCSSPATSLHPVASVHLHPAKSPQAFPGVWNQRSEATVAAGAAAASTATKSFMLVVVVLLESTLNTNDKVNQTFATTTTTTTTITTLRQHKQRQQQARARPTHQPKKKEKAARRETTKKAHT